MTELVFLSSKDYPSSKSTNYGDCILINTGNELIIYDCGSEKHAEKAIDYMDSHGFSKASFVLSHNDDDHFLGLPYLLEKERISSIYTVLLLKHTDDVLEAIDDGRKSRKSVKNEILDTYDNISKLSGCNLNDIYDESNAIIATPFSSANISFVGPTYEYMIDAVAKRLDGREGDTIDGETVVNATSIQLSIEFNSHKILLCGDCSFAAISEVLDDHDIIQLPHHGKPKQAEQIFEAKWADAKDTVYLVSDNTGNTNGGSDDLEVSGRKVINTKDNPIYIDSAFLNSLVTKTKGVLCL